ncbi:MAG: hypothetical protein AB8B87_18950 [Granulosicoccus sp.]
MKYQHTNRTTRASLLLVSAFAAMGLVGCESELILDEAGPDNPVSDSYQLEYFPSRVSLDIPKTVFKGSELTVSLQQSDGVSGERKLFSSRMDDTDSGKSEGWLELNEQFDVLRWEGEEFSTRWHDNGNVAKFVTASEDSHTLELVEGKPGRILPTATLVAVQ